MFKGARSEGIPGVNVHRYLALGYEDGSRGLMHPTKSFATELYQVSPGTRTTAPWSVPPTFNPRPGQYRAPHTERWERGSGSVLVYFLSVVTVTRTRRVGPGTLNRTSCHCPLPRAQPLGLPLALHRLACGGGHTLLHRWCATFPRGEASCRYPTWLHDHQSHGAAAGFHSGFVNR